VDVVATADVVEHAASTSRLWVAGYNRVEAEQSLRPAQRPVPASPE